ncbi:alpha/beta hydrolase [Flavobacterium sp. Sd200]|uniref:alpha/beta hydrolase n=1 Tax=Flavobacterium sp. Sd200 TaxID=2692211 RepID=UPI00137202C9|nr:alpha/beta hydrolase [Flavobacterium sp. Sd200]MXN91684.1 alpha/beta hydrolase [Flavobacterium sp. Sd200]
MNLVLIHGRDQQGQDKDVLVKTWIDALNKGLDKNGFTLPESTNIIFPFYGDLLDDLVQEIEKPQTAANAKGTIDDSQLEFEFELYSEVAGQAGITDQQISQYVDGPKEKGPLNWEWVQGILRALDQHTPLGDVSVERFTRDVYTYLYYNAVRAKINDFIIGELQPGPTVLVGHSLGSVVGYNVLREADVEIVDYITIGSPLGLKSIKKKLATPLQFPDVIEGKWYNAYDDRDYVALKPLDKHNFNIDPPIINSNHVKNSTKNRHGITGYLDDKQVANKIYEALTRNI